MNSALLLLSIYETEKDNGSDLKSIIAFADYVNHAIMTYNEFNNSMNYLLNNKLVKEIDKRFFVDDTFKKWFSEKYKENTKLNVSKAVESIQKYLNGLNEENNGMKWEIAETDFENGVKEYKKIVEEALLMYRKKK